MAITPDQFEEQPSRPIDEIARDILRFPVERNPNLPFASAERVPPDDKYTETFTHAVHSTVDGSNAQDGKSSLVEKKLANSSEVANQLLDALQAMADTGRFTPKQRGVVAKYALPILELTARKHDEMALESEQLLDSGEGAEIDKLFGHMREDAGHSKKSKHPNNLDADSEAYFITVAQNCRGELRKLMGELGRAMKVNLESKFNLNAG